VDTFAQNQTLYKRPQYNSLTDFVPVALVVEQPLILVARNDLPINNLPDFIAYAKANQDKMQYGSAGAGSGSHLACAQLNAAIGVDTTHVPYRGSAPAMQDIMAGRIDYFCALAAAAMPQLGSNSMKALAILTRNRSPLVPNLATAHEQGLTDFAAANWLAFFLPKGTQAAIVHKLNDVAVAAMTTPAVAARLKDIGADVVAPDRRSPEFFAEVRRKRDREMGCADQGGGRQRGVSTMKIPSRACRRKGVCTRARRASGLCRGHAGDCACMDARGSASGRLQPPWPTRD